MGRKRHPQHEDEEQSAEQSQPADDVDGASGVADPVDDGATATGMGDEESLRQRVAELEAEAAEWKERAHRMAADMENLRRRTQREAEDSRRFANERILSDLLPVLDNFTRALEAAEQSSNFEALKAGVEQTQRQFADALARAGLEKIEAVGQPFDPNMHEAILQVPADDDQPANHVVEELRAGYRLNDRVVRPSLVKVSSG